MIGQQKISSRRSASGHKLDGEDIDPVVEVLAEEPDSKRASRFSFSGGDDAGYRSSNFVSPRTGAWQSARAEEFGPG